MATPKKKKRIRTKIHVKRQSQIAKDRLATCKAIVAQLGVSHKNPMFGQVYTTAMSGLLRGEEPDHIVGIMNASRLMKTVRGSETIKQPTLEAPPPKQPREPAKRINMADVIAYLAEKNSKKIALAAQQEVSSVPRRQAPRKLTHAGAITVKHENPRVYNIPNMKGADKILSDRDRARKLQAQQEPVKVPVVELVPELLPEALPEEVSVVPVVELLPEVVAEPEIIQEPQPEPQPEPITVKPEPGQRKEPAPVLMLPKRPKRAGHEVMVISRPDQADFSAAVRRNCFDHCVITGARLRQRTEAAHLTEHSAGGVDHYTNGLLLRVDLHRLFDAGVIAICPETLTVNVEPDALTDDPDLQQYHGKKIAELRRPIDPANLVERWEHFQCRLRMIELMKEFN